MHNWFAKEGRLGLVLRGLASMCLVPEHRGYRLLTQQVLHHLHLAEVACPPWAMSLHHGLRAAGRHQHRDEQMLEAGAEEARLAGGTCLHRRLPLLPGARTVARLLRPLGRHRQYVLARLRMAATGHTCNRSPTGADAMQCRDRFGGVLEHADQARCPAWALRRKVTGPLGVLSRRVNAAELRHLRGKEVRRLENLLNEQLAKSSAEVSALRRGGAA
mmetsp:Transcript_123624/g.357582  ORF Transcript_123624/g.357582 Transcript_123624/m.357582 type:complete len:217 (-) Transcript_123624:323-973(-)